MTDEPLLGTNLLERIREGMTVIDASGRSLGSITRLQMGDPEAVTTAGNEPPPSLLGTAWSPDPDGLGDVPEVLRRNLRRAGFIEVDAPDLHGAERLIPGDRISDVTGDTVRLHPPPAVQPGPADISAETSEPYRSFPIPHTERLDDEPTPWLAGGRARLLAGASLAVAVAVGTWAYLRRRRAQSRPIKRVQRLATRVRGRSAEALENERASTGAKVLPVLLAFALWMWRARRPA